MDKSGNRNQVDYGEYIASAMKTEGGHLSIGRGGFILHFGNGSRLSGYDCDHIKRCCIEAGLPVIDSRMADFDDVARLSVNGPMPAVGRGADMPPWHALSFAPLGVVAKAWQEAGAEVFNISEAWSVAQAKHGEGHHRTV
jgi:hypothetical protein